MKQEEILFAPNVKKILPAGDGGYVAVYEQFSNSQFKKYVSQLEEKGYTLYASSSFNGENDEKKNTFYTYVSDENTVSLGHHSYNNRLYVTVMPRKEGLLLPPAEAPAYTPVGEEWPTELVSIGFEDFDNREASMGYVIRLADGTFIVYDSAEHIPGVEDRIYEVLRKMAPDPENIVISAWMFSHAHMDHIGGFILFAKKYAQGYGITLRQAVYNYPEDEICGSLMAGFQNSQREAIALFGDVPLLKPHAGDVLYYADVKFNVLYTQDEYLAVVDHIRNHNAISTVYQMVTADGCKILFGADHPVSGNMNGDLWCEGAIYHWYGSFIESDVVTTFHHGFGGGADGRVYGVIKPRIVLWDVEQYRIELNSLVNYSTNAYFANPELAKQNGVEACYVQSDKMHVLHFANGRASVTEYANFEEYLKA